MIQHSTTRPLDRLTTCLLLCLAASAAHAAGDWTEVEQAIGKLTLEEMKLRHGTVSDPLLQEWVDRIAAPIAALPGRDVTYRFTILNSHENNAFSLPGGYICVMRGLLNHVTSDDELAGVLAHEVAHSENKDFQRMVRQQLLYLGAQGLMRGKVDDEWIYATRVIQMLDGLRRQRKHELQADITATDLSYQARYDPEGLTAFLGVIGPGQSPEFLATHPRAQKRLQAVHERVAQLSSGDYNGLLAIGDSLRGRLRVRRAAAIYQQAEQLAPQRSEAQQRLADLAAARAASSREPEAELALPEDQRAKIAAGAPELLRREQEQYAAEEQLRRNLQRFARDRDIARALQAAQVVAPESEDLRYLVTLARGYYTLEAAYDEAVRQGELLSRSSAIREGWDRSAADLQRTHKVSGLTAANEAELRQAAERYEQAIPSVVATTAAIARCANVAAELTTATRLLAAAFLALVASGPDQPLGKLNYTRFLLLQGDITIAEQRIRRVTKAGREVQAEVVRQHLDAVTEQMSILHATAGPALRELDRKLIARRLDVPSEGPAIRQPAVPPDPTMGRPIAGSSEGRLGALISTVAPPSLPVADLLAIDTVVRMCYLDMRGERMP